MAAVSKTVRWCWALGLALLASVALPSGAISGVDDPAPPAGPSVTWLRPGLAVIIDEGSVAVVGDAEMQLQACESPEECAVPEQEGVDNVVILDHSPPPASAPSEAAASEPGAVPR